MTDQPRTNAIFLYSAAQTRELDRLATKQLAIPGFELMQRAGRQAWSCCQTLWPEAGRISVVCGAGNNAGDGYILAAEAAECGLSVTVLAVIDPESLQGDARKAAVRLVDAGVNILPYSAGTIIDADVIIDAILGTGLDRNLDGIFLDAVNSINASDKPVFAIDIPSGLNADTGQSMNAVVIASHTITFIGRKQGLYTGEAALFCGEIHFADLGVPHGVYENVGHSAELVRWDDIAELIPARSPVAHKGHFGHVLVIGGDYGYAGAVRLAAEAAARSGAGLVSVATRPEHAFAIPTARPEIMAHAVANGFDLAPLLDRATVVAIGPGLGQSEWGISLLARCLESALPLIVDADALNLLAQEPATRDNWILTPHPGEAARLLRCPVTEIQSDRYRAACNIHKNHAGVVVLKGKGSIIVDDQGDIAVCDGGNPGMASGGMGDVLTGIIAGLVAQGHDTGRAARIAVCLHARAAEHAAEEGERGLLAGDLLPWIQRLANP